MIIAVFGLPGSGKSYFASALARRIGAHHVSSDAIRKALFPEPTYSDSEKEAVYRELYNTMYDFLHRRQPLVMDATFYKKHIRDQFNKEAASIGCEIAWIEIRAYDQTIRKRLATPREDSDADYDVHKLIRDTFDPMRKPHLILVSSDDNLEAMLSSAEFFIERFKPKRQLRSDHIKQNVS